MSGLLGIISLIGGAILVFVAGIGMLRMPDLFLRMSTTTKAATLGVGLMLLGVAIFFGDLGTASRAFVIFAFFLATAPISAHMIGRAAYSTGVPLWEGTLVDELKGQYQKVDNEMELSSGVYGSNGAQEDSH